MALINSAIKQQVNLERLKSGEVNQFTAFLKQIDRGIRERLSGKEVTDYSRARLEKLLVVVDRMLSDVFENFYDDLSGHLIEIGEYQAEYEAGALMKALPDGTGFETIIPALPQIRAAVFSTPLGVKGPGGGELLEPFIRDWSHAEVKRVSGAIRQGYFEGQTNSQIIRNIRGTKANGYRDGILATTNRNAEAVVRTAVQHAASSARFETWKANNAIIKGYRWLSTLDGRTSPICRALDGQVYEIGKGPRPPVHIRCRSTTVAELTDEFSRLSQGRTRASKDGQVSADQTYYDWLKSQSAEFQDGVLGPTMGNVFRNGNIDAEKFARLSLHKNFQPVTVAELRKKLPAEFARANS